MSAHPPGFIARVVGAFVKSKVTPLIIGFSIFLGLVAVFNLPREEEPQIAVPMFDIFVAYPGATAEEVERRIVNVGERKLWEIAGVEYIYSTIQAEGAVIMVRFRVGEDVEKSLIKLYTKVYANLDLLARGGSQPLIKIRSIDDVPIMTLTFHGAAGSQTDPVAVRKVVADVQNSVNSIPDVSETNITGGRRRQFHVYLDSGKLSARMLNPLEIGQMIRQANVKAAAGHLEGGEDIVNVETDGFFRSKADLENLVIGVSQGTEVYLKEVARVVDGADEDEAMVDIRLASAENAGTLQAPQPAVTLSVSKRKGANASRLCQKIIKKLEGLRGNVIPAGVEYTVTRNYGETADEKSNELLFHMGLAVLGVTILMALALGWRESGVVAVAIPMTLSLTLAGFYFLGFTLNRITLFALIFSIGILVDDPIVGVENIVRHLRMARNKGRELLDVTIEAFQEVQSPLILATLTVIAAILPMAFVSGLMGPYMRPIPIGSSLAMVFSMMVAFVATPWAAYRILGSAARQGKLHGPGTEGEKDDLLTVIYRSYMKPLIYKAPVRTGFIIVLLILLALSVWLVPAKLVKVKMLPFDNKNEFQVVLDMPEGTPFEKTRAVLAELADHIGTVPEVKNITAYVGTSAPYNFNGLVRHYFLRSQPWQGDLQVNLAGKNERKRQSHAIASSIRPRVHEIVSRYGGHVQVAEVPPGPPVLSTLVLEVYGPTLEGERKLANDVEALLTANSGVTDIGSYVGREETLDSLKVDQKKCSLNGVAVDSVTAMVAGALAGQKTDLAHLPGENEPLDIVLRLPKEKRLGLDSVLELTVLSRFGNRIPLADLVKVERTKKDLTIYHKNLARVSYIIGDVQGRFDSPVYAMLDLNNDLEKLSLPEPKPAAQTRPDLLFNGQPENADRWTIKWDGEWQITFEVFRDLGIAFGIVLILIFTLVVGWFQSFKTPFIIMLPIPLTLIGILPAHWMTGTFFTATSMIGMIAGAGIVVRNSIILVDFIELRLKEGMPLEEAVIDAGAKRFRPMLLTAAAVVVGASVILFDPIFQGLALSLIAGEVASTILSRTAVPVIYYMVMRQKAATQGG
ncbi:MAG: efflux RND transporter permease subunit [Candidatus Omnitrophica bacterium]|nr:efflux RND transporter permease subunit [Candidatus Omnitrophota bacterium]